MRETDVLVANYIDENPGQTKSQIASALQLPMSDVAGAISRLRWHDMVMSDDDGGMAGRSQRRWFGVDHGSKPFTHIVIPAASAERVLRSMPVSVFHLAAGVA